MLNDRDLEKSLQGIAEDRRGLPKPNAVLTPVRDLFA